jgi:6-phosphofructokinase 1
VILLDKQKEKFPKLGLTKILIPATISNNLPATEFSIGSDTSLNNILEAMDKIKQVRRRPLAASRCQGLRSLILTDVRRTLVL